MSAAIRPYFAENFPSRAKNQVFSNVDANGQDWKIGDLSVTLVSQAGDKAVVEAKFSNLGDAEDLRYDLVHSGGRWLIDEIQSMTKPRWTMSKILAGAPDAFPDQ